MRVMRLVQVVSVLLFKGPVVSNPQYDSTSARPSAFSFLSIRCYGTDIAVVKGSRSAWPAMRLIPLHRKTCL